MTLVLWSLSFLWTHVVVVFSMKNYIWHAIIHSLELKVFTCIYLVSPTRLGAPQVHVLCVQLPCLYHKSYHNAVYIDIIPWQLDTQQTVVDGSPASCINWKPCFTNGTWSFSPLHSFIHSFIHSCNKLLNILYVLETVLIPGNVTMNNTCFLTSIRLQYCSQTYISFACMLDTHSIVCSHTHIHSITGILPSFFYIITILQHITY